MAGRTNDVSKMLKVRTLFKSKDPAQFTLNDLPSIYGEIDLSVQSELDTLVLKIKDGLQELKEAFNRKIEKLKEHILNELGVAGRSSSSFGELNSRALKIRGISGENRIESFVFQISEITNENKDFEKLAWLILSKPPKNWIDQDVDKLLVEATRFAREFRNLETMASINEHKETSYSFALVSHSKGRGTDSQSKIFELNENELMSAKHFAKKLKSLKTSDNKKLDRKTVLAALSILSEELEKD